MNEPVLTTERLLLRPLTMEDAEVVFIWNSDPAVNKYMSYPLYTDIQQTRNWLAGIKDAPGYTFGITLKESGELIGSGGIYYHEDTGVWSFGYNLRQEYWKHGYATEAMRCIIKFVHEKLGGTEFSACHASENPASGRVLEKCGLQFERDTEYSKLDGSVTFQARQYRMHLDSLK